MNLQRHPNQLSLFAKCAAKSSARILLETIWGASRGITGRRPVGRVVSVIEQLQAESMMAVVQAALPHPPIFCGVPRLAGDQATTSTEQLSMMQAETIRRRGARRRAIDPCSLERLEARSMMAAGDPTMPIMPAIPMLIVVESQGTVSLLKDSTGLAYVQEVGKQPIVVSRADSYWNGNVPLTRSGATMLAVERDSLGRVRVLDTSSYGQFGWILDARGKFSMPMARSAFRWPLLRWWPRPQCEIARSGSRCGGWVSQWGRMESSLTRPGSRAASSRR